MEDLDKFCVFDVIDSVAIIVLTDDMNAHSAEILIDYLFETDTYHYRLLDFDAYPCNISKRDIEGLAEYDKKFPEKNWGALVTNDNRTYDLMRKYAKHRQTDKKATIQVFKDMHEGVCWLREKQEKNS